MLTDSSWWIFRKSTSQLVDFSGKHFAAGGFLLGGIDLWKPVDRGMLRHGKKRAFNTSDSVGIKTCVRTEHTFVKEKLLGATRLGPKEQAVASNAIRHRQRARSALSL